MATIVEMLAVDILLAMATRDMLVKQGIIPTDIMKYFFYYLYLKTIIKKMASAVAMMIGSAVVNALAFSGSNYLFSQMGKSDDAEKKRDTRQSCGTVRRRTSCME